MTPVLDQISLISKRERGPWFDPSLSFNPAVHRIKQALFHAAIVPNLVDHPIPPPHPDLMRYFDSPPKMIKRSSQSLEKCIHAFNINPVPRKVAKRKVEMHVAAVEDDDLILPPSKKFRQASPGVDTLDVDLLPKTLGNSQDADDDQQPHSETEPETDEEGQTGGKTIHASEPEDGTLDPTSHAPDDDMIIDRAVPEGRIVGFTHPLDDFKNNLVSGDVVTKAVEDLGFIVQEIALRPFAARRHDELLQCLREMRVACLREDEVDLWNEWVFLTCFGESHHLII